MFSMLACFTEALAGLAFFSLLYLVCGSPHTIKLQSALDPCLCVPWSLATIRHKPGTPARERGLQVRAVSLHSRSWSGTAE